MMLSTVPNIFRSNERFRPGMDIFVNRAYEAFKLPQHTHDAIEISYVTEGTGFQYINDTIVPVRQGDIFLLPLGTSHVYRPSSPAKVGTLAVINCVFRLEALKPWPDFPPHGSLLYAAMYAPDKLEQPWFHLYDKDSAFADLFYTLLTEYRQRQPGYEPIVHALFIRLIALLHRHTVLTSSRDRRNAKIEEAMQYIKDHCCENIKLKQVADHSFLSVSHLQRLLRQSTGCSFTSYVQLLRIKRCCELLKTTSMTVQQIASAVGYQDMKYFHALFRRKTGMTPQQFRKNEDDGLTPALPQSLK